MLPGKETRDSTRLKARAEDHLRRCAGKDVGDLFCSLGNSAPDLLDLGLSIGQNRRSLLLDWGALGAFLIEGSEALIGGELRSVFG